MAEFENDNPESNDFINLDKPEAEVVVPEPSEAEETHPEVTSTTEDMASSQPEADETFEKQDNESVPEESPKESSESEEKPPVSQPDSTSSPSTSRGTCTDSIAHVLNGVIVRSCTHIT
jgi:outer membrane biosynthesis protein TonB